MMCRIYSLAKKTLVRLGTASPRTNDAVALCKILATKAQVTDPATQLVDDKFILQEEHRLALSDLFERQWWTRVWVVQELCLSEDVDLVLGSAILPWSVSDAAISHFMERRMTFKNMIGKEA